jgi:large subunit ribosomal protein L5
MNKMKEIRMEKLTLNMGIGESGPKVENAKSIMQKIVGDTKVVITKTEGRTTFGMAQKRDIGVKVTLRGKEAMDLLKRLLEAVENRMKPSQFDSSGNFSFGVHEYINIPGIKYDPDVGIIGMDVCVTLQRPGFRVKKKMIRPGKIGRSHRITPAESMEWAIKNFGIKTSEEEE